MEKAIEKEERVEFRSVESLRSALGCIKRELSYHEEILKVKGFGDGLEVRRLKSAGFFVEEAREKLKGVTKVWDGDRQYK